MAIVNPLPRICVLHSQVSTKVAKEPDFGGAIARAITEAWLEEYNAIRPHESLGGLTPDRYADEARN